MSARIARRAALAALLVLAARDLRAGEGTAKTAPAEGHRERPEDAPAPAAARAVTLAPSAVVSRGNHVSVQVNTGPGGANILGDAANEPTMAVDPTDPANLVIGWRQFDTVTSNFRQAGYAYSHDGGATWTFPGVLQPGQFRSDPVVAADKQGRFYYNSLSSTTSAEMFISSDKGHTWVGPIPAWGGDKNWMTVDVSETLGAGNIHELWNSQFTCCAAGTDYTRSIDGGFQYQGPYSMPTKVKWGTLDAGPDGRLWVVGANLFTSGSPAHYVLRSSNAYNRGQVPAFEWTTGINLGGTTIAGGIPNPGGLLGQVWIAVDRTPGGPFEGRVYVLASVDPPGGDPMDVKFISSSDGGLTWSAPQRVNDEPSGNAYQWFGAMSLAPGGRIDVTWYDTRSSPAGTISEVYYAYSIDGGAHWSAGLPVSPPFNSTIGHPNQNKIGDYTHMASDASGAALAYAATFNGEQDVWFVRAGDCNANGRHDSLDIQAGTSADCNGSGHPDECEVLREVCTGGSDEDCDGAIDCADLDDCAAACGCDVDGVCEPGEDCQSCPSDCPTVLAPCGDGVCNPEAGESCLSCPTDCAGVQSGNPNNQFCCGPVSSGATNPIGCTDPRCTQNGFACARLLPRCCGDQLCESGETPCACGLDCGVATPQETACADGIDNDCDAGTDCADTECATLLPAPPAGSPLLHAGFTVDASDVRLTWVAPPGSISFDVVEGDLDSLAAGSGLGASTRGCLADDRLEAWLDVPGGAGNRWYLVRPRSCDGVGTYDDGTPGQPAPRDAVIGSSGGCP